MAAPRTHHAPASSVPPQVSTAMPKDRKLRLEPPPAADPPPYEVGYRKPPAASQFKPGRSGNPKGWLRRREKRAAFTGRRLLCRPRRSLNTPKRPQRLMLL